MPTEDEKELALKLAPQLAGKYDVPLIDETGALTDEGAIAIAVRVASAISGSLGRMGAQNFQQMMEFQLEHQQILNRLEQIERWVERQTNK